MSYPDVVIAQEHKVFPGYLEQLEAALVVHDNNMKDYSVVDWSP